MVWRLEILASNSVQYAWKNRCSPNPVSEGMACGVRMRPSHRESSNFSKHKNASKWFKYPKCQNGTPLMIPVCKFSLRNHWYAPVLIVNLFCLPPKLCRLVTCSIPRPYFEDMEPPQILPQAKLAAYPVDVYFRYWYVFAGQYQSTCPQNFASLQSSFT